MISSFRSVLPAKVFGLCLSFYTISSSYFLLFLSRTGAQRLHCTAFFSFEERRIFAQKCLMLSLQGILLGFDYKSFNCIIENPLQFEIIRTLMTSALVWRCVKMVLWQKVQKLLLRFKLVKFIDDVSLSMVISRCYLVSTIFKRISRLMLGSLFACKLLMSRKTFEKRRDFQLCTINV